MDRTKTLKKIAAYVERPDVIKEPTIEEISHVLMLALEEIGKLKSHN